MCVRPDQPQKAHVLDRPLVANRERPGRHRKTDHRLSWPSCRYVPCGMPFMVCGPPLSAVAGIRDVSIDGLPAVSDRMLPNDQLGITCNSGLNRDSRAV